MNTTRTARAVGLLVVATIGLVGGSTGSASSADSSPSPGSHRVAERLPVPGNGRLTLHGRGYGHGHGLSQYGAEGAARQGLTARQIIHFYYPHTKAGTAAHTVRVLISADTDDNTTVVAQPGTSVRDLATGTTTALPTDGDAAAATEWRLSARDGGGTGTDVSYLTDTWHLWTTLGGDGELLRHGGLSLVVGAGTVDYRGSLQSLTPTDGKAGQRVTVNRLAMDAYLRSVVPREMPASWHPAALKAQAIAARTYASYEVEHSTNPLYQLCDTSSCQVYGGRSSEYPSTDQAVEATAGQIRTYRGDAAFTQFSASDGGWTSDGGEPYLVAQKDPYDAWSGNHVSPWTTRLAARTIEHRWPKLGRLRSITIDQREGHGRWGGRVLQLTLDGSRRHLIISGDAFRLTLGLRSTWFTVGA